MNVPFLNELAEGSELSAIDNSKLE